jgi:signal transduction histidine kinase
LRAKIVLILAAVVLAYAALDHLVQRVLVFDSFIELEETAGRADLDRATRAIEGELMNLTSDCAASASSEETYLFAAQGNDRALEENILPQAFRSREHSLLFVVDPRGHVVWGMARDVITRQEIKLRDFPAKELAAGHALMPIEGRPRVNGILMTEVGPLLVSAEPIVGSQKDAPSRGTLILGRPLDKPLTYKLVQRCGVDFQIFAINDARLPADVQAIRDEVATSDNALLRAADDEHLVMYGKLPDVRQLPALIVRAQINRDITAIGTRAVRYALTSTVAAGALLLLILLKLLQRAVLQPIAALTSHAVEIARSEDFTRRIGSDRPDEIGVLAREFDGLIGRVEQSRADLVKVARAAGMSEVATGVLHNVGNVLNSVNVSANLVSERVRRSASGDLTKVVRTLEPHAGNLAQFVANDPKGKHLLPLLRSIGEELEAERARVQTEVKAMCEGIEHVKVLVQAQQGYAGRTGVMEVVSIAEQVESALNFTAQAFQSTKGLEIVREFDPLPACRIDRHRLMEILVNIIQNARQATLGTNTAPRIVLRVRDLGAGRVRVEVQDNGVGIPKENLARIFTHGFTTKQDGHGFGLHASANGAREMGGDLTAHSDGPGCGATFALEFPVQAPAPVEVSA